MQDSCKSAGRFSAQADPNVVTYGRQARSAGRKSCFPIDDCRTAVRQAPLFAVVFGNQNRQSAINWITKRNAAAIVAKRHRVEKDLGVLVFIDSLP